MVDKGPSVAWEGDGANFDVDCSSTQRNYACEPDQLPNRPDNPSTVVIGAPRLLHFVSKAKAGSKVSEQEIEAGNKRDMHAAIRAAAAQWCFGSSWSQRWISIWGKTDDACRYIERGRIEPRNKL